MTASSSAFVVQLLLTMEPSFEFLSEVGWIPIPDSPRHVDNQESGN